ncbi:sodium:calcium exchanger [Halarcobacter mediterraneus]|uniref:Sodium:calcium exchanger n=1 Tax=Halarcobacter mediterraneus TaxID=2023153 RepID=A0A4Q1AU68_9BACT|nr:Calx-beta domain-containing protein [Halarcobacter mediterraneus]RXK12293.1 sodium:calcium exchanger [Halarcobacter mediterraneus]
MTTYLNDYRSYIYQTNYTDSYNAVVRVSNTESYGTGALLYDGRSILTAAHIFEGYNTDNITVYFDTAWGTQAYSATLNIYDYYDSLNSNGDIAILTVDENPSAFYERYDIYRGDDELGSNFTMVGYGAYGSGSTGKLEYETEILKLKTTNTFEADFYSIDLSSKTNLSWDPLQSSILAADFDSGYTSNDALGYLLNINDLGNGTTEGMIASGDSGGPAFIDGLIAGIASYTVSLSSNFNELDVNNIIDSSFGEIGAWQRVSYYSEWIDKTIREGYENAPTSRDEVQTEILEADEGDISYAYFLLEFLEDRDNVSENITLNYTTRDGSATAGEDYIATSGVITLYKDESQVIIPVEVLGDNISEGNETFYLDVTNPSYGSLGDNTSTLTAVRTIIDDDYNIA